MLLGMLQSLMKKSNPELDKTLETVKELNEKYDGVRSKFFIFFALWFTLLIFVFSLILTVVLTAFILTGELPEEIKDYIFIGAPVAVIVATSSFIGMRKLWRKLRKPAEKELKLEL